MIATVFVHLRCQAGRDGAQQIIPKINRLHLSNLTVNRLRSLVWHDLGEIGHLQLDNVMTSDVPNPISVGGEAKIGALSTTPKNEN